ncbi:MAG: DUF4295 domain-containing protein [Bacteroidia bacterium]|jgi:hypothetical protein|nr:DUF4295 domain-containing protein [Bacteroidia bacterium]MCO5253664.1 DUF4295 domain-containing protein [Bacteroidota bacterium]MCO6494720.1 DUF4295 domain-containing protein [Bacteroidota bacterium]MCZ2129636.1 DUF4295 domain-containing protein [Bacteroidia bacterium]
MAKKAISKLQGVERKGYIKVIKAVKSEKTGAYTFKEEVLPEDLAKNYFKS